MQNNSRICSGCYLSIALEEELEVLDFVLWLNYCYFVLLDCFPLFLYFLTSLITLALWNLGKAEEAKAFLQTRVRGHEGFIPGKTLQGPTWFPTQDCINERGTSIVELSVGSPL